jgi:hypothetical protein
MIAVKSLRAALGAEEVLDELEEEWRPLPPVMAVLKALISLRRSRPLYSAQSRGREATNEENIGPMIASLKIAFNRCDELNVECFDDEESPLRFLRGDLRRSVLREG